MSVRRLDRVNELLKREIATALYRVMNERGFDLAAVSITRVLASSDLRSARVMVSIRDHRSERREILAMLKRHRREIQEIIHDNIILKYTPHLNFALDESLEKGDEVLRLISELDEADGPPEDPPGDVDNGEGRA